MLLTTLLELLIVIIGVAILALQFSNRKKTGNLIAAVVGGTPPIGSVENKKKHDIWDIENGPQERNSNHTSPTHHSTTTSNSSMMDSTYDHHYNHNHYYSHHSQSSQPYYDNGMNISSSMTPNNLRWRRDSTISSSSSYESASQPYYPYPQQQQQPTFTSSVSSYPVPFSSPMYTNQQYNGNTNTSTPLYPAYVSPLGPTGSSSVSSSIRLGGNTNIISSTNLSSSSSSSLTYASSPMGYRINNNNTQPNYAANMTDNNGGYSQSTETIPSPWNTSSTVGPQPYHLTASSPQPSYPPWMHTTDTVSNPMPPSTPMISSPNLPYAASNVFDSTPHEGFIETKNNKNGVTTTTTTTISVPLMDTTNGKVTGSKVPSMMDSTLSPTEPTNTSEGTKDSNSHSSSQSSSSSLSTTNGATSSSAVLPAVQQQQSPQPQLAILGGGSLNILAFGKLQFVNVQKDQPIWKPRPAPAPVPVLSSSVTTVQEEAASKASTVQLPNTEDESSIVQSLETVETDASHTLVTHGTESNPPQPLSSTDPANNTVNDPAATVNQISTAPPTPVVVYTRTPRADFDIDWNALQLGPEIGQGAFGRVYRAKWRGTNVAVKALYTNGLNLTGQEIEDLRAEIATLSALRHPNILLFMGACTEAPHACLVTEYMPRGSLWDLLHAPDENTATNPAAKLRPLEMNYILRASLDVAKGMAYLHSASPPILHRDLKSPNLLLDDSFGVKISDFGLARVKASTLTMTGGTGTFQWMAPEVLANQRYTEKADIYSYGIILWELLTREVPYGEMQQIQVAIAVLTTGLRPTIPNDTPAGLRKLITDCWHADALQRPDFLEIIERLEWIMEEQSTNNKVI